MVGDGGAEGVAAVGGEEEGEEKSVERRGLRGGDATKEIPTTSSLKHGRREKRGPNKQKRFQRGVEGCWK